MTTVKKKFLLKLNVIILIFLAYFIYIIIGDLQWYGFSPIAQIVDIENIKNIAFLDILLLHHATPPLLSLLRKISIDFNFQATYSLNILFFIISIFKFYDYLNANFNNKISTISMGIYLISPSTWLFITYEYDMSMFVSLTLIYVISILNISKNEKLKKNDVFWISIAGFLLTGLSSKFSLIITTISIIYFLNTNKDVKAKIIITLCLLNQFIIPIYNYSITGIFSNSSWIGLNLSLVTQNVSPEKKQEMFTFYNIEKISKITCNNEKYNNYNSIYFSCNAIKASKNDLHISKKIILENPLKFLNEGIKNFKKSLLDFPDNYINSGMSYERLSFKTYQRDTDNRVKIYLLLIINGIIYYLIPLIGFLLVFFTKNKSMLLLTTFVFLNYVMVSLVNGIELGRMKVYSLPYILILLPIILGYLPSKINSFKNKVWN